MPPTINWNEGTPAGTDSLGIGDDEIRSLKSSLRIGLDGEHVWPSSGGDAGVHRLGSARPYVGAQSLVSSTGTDGRLMVTSDTSRLFGVGSGGTVFLGGPTVIAAGSFPGSIPQRAVWVEEWGEGKTVASGTTTIAFPNSGYSGRPNVLLTVLPSSIVQTAHIIGLGSVGAGSFTAVSHTTGGAQSSVSFFWRSLGTRTL